MLPRLRRHPPARYAPGHPGIKAQQKWAPYVRQPDYRLQSPAVVQDANPSCPCGAFFAPSPGRGLCFTGVALASHPGGCATSNFESCIFVQLACFHPGGALFLQGSIHRGQVLMHRRTVASVWSYVLALHYVGKKFSVFTMANWRLCQQHGRKFDAEKSHVYH